MLDRVPPELSVHLFDVVEGVHLWNISQRGVFHEAIDVGWSHVRVFTSTKEDVHGQVIVLIHEFWKILRLQSIS